MHPELEIMQYGTALLLLILAVLLCLGLLTLNSLIAPNNPTKEKQLSYECGEDPVGTAWLRFNIRFYVVALVFVLFDVELALIYPVAVIYKGLTTGTAAFQPALIVFTEMFFFLAVLFLGLVYIWQKGDLGWIRTFRAPTDQGLRSWKEGATQTNRMVPSEKSRA